MPKEIKYYNTKFEAHFNMRMDNITDAKVVKMKQGWTLSRMSGVGNMRIKEYLRVNGKVE